MIVQLRNDLYRVYLYGSNYSGPNVAMVYFPRTGHLEMVKLKEYIDLVFKGNVVEVNKY